MPVVGRRLLGGRVDARLKKRTGGPDRKVAPDQAGGVVLPPAAFRALVALVVGSFFAACGRPPHLANGPIDLADESSVVRFAQPVASSGPRWEICFEFDLPRESHRAAGIHVALLSTTGRRDELGDPGLDRRGEAVVCQIGQLPAAPEPEPPTSYEAVELRSDASVRVRAIRGGSLQ